MSSSDPFDLKTLRLTGDQVGERLAAVPAKIQKRRQHFIKLPMTWYERLRGAHGQTYRVAWHLLYLHWKGGGRPIKLATGMLVIDGVPATSKRRALHDLERRGLIQVEPGGPRKSPIVRLISAADGTLNAP
jgi:hypothetical protein